MHFKCQKLGDTGENEKKEFQSTNNHRPQTETSFLGSENASIGFSGKFYHRKSLSHVSRRSSHDILDFWNQNSGQRNFDPVSAHFRPSVAGNRFLNTIFLKWNFFARTFDNFTEKNETLVEGCNSCIMDIFWNVIFNLLWSEIQKIANNWWKNSSMIIHRSSSKLTFGYRKLTLLGFFALFGNPVFTKCILQSVTYTNKWLRTYNYQC